MTEGNDDLSDVAAATELYPDDATAPTKIVHGVPPPTFTLTPRTLLQQAIEAGASLDVIQHLTAWDERIARAAKRKPFDTAMVRFKAEMPTIEKTKLGGSYAGKAYRYEELADITAITDPKLAKYGLYSRFEVLTKPPGQVTVSCFVHHVDGYWIENNMSAPVDLTKGNPLHQIATATTYLQRYTLKAALGLAAAVDDDAQSLASHSNGQGDLISPEQVEKLTELLSKCEEIAPGSKRRWYEKAGITRVEQLRVGQYKNACDALEGKLKKSEPKHAATQS